MLAVDFAGNERFRVVSQLGAGGMGVVYRAIDQERDTPVAIKLLRNPDSEGVLRFKREFRSIQGLHHPNLVSLGELVSEGTHLFFTMELLIGVDFVDWTCPGRHHGTDDISVRSPRLVRSDAATIKSEPPTNEVLAPRPRGLFEEARLRDALAQLADVLVFLHENGIVHRDVKPNNIIVRANGQLCLLDLGLATDSNRIKQLTTQHIMGTVLYMAPEQAASKPVGPPADMYSVGVMLYEALAGTLPFDGPQLEVLMRKQVEPPPRIPDAEKLPPDLVALCMDLLAFNPESRPSGRKLLARLGRKPSATSASSVSLSQSGAFVGRADELRALKAAFTATATNAVKVVVEGESGVGKTALVQRFVASLDSHEPRPLVLSGFCYERESVPYKAFDGIVEELASILGKSGNHALQELLPENVALLAQMFPLLRRVEAIAQAPRGEHITDLREVRTRGFAAFRDLIGRIARRAPVILTIDDLQWVDADSRALLQELLRPPAPAQLLVIMTVRSFVDADLLPPGDFVRLSVTRLPAADAENLATRLLSLAPNRPDLNVASLVQESGGHPLLIDELVRHSLTGERAIEKLRLEDAFWSRISSLAEPIQRLLKLITVAGAPLRQEAAARAAEVEYMQYRKEVALLQSAHLVRTTGARGHDTVQPFHDRVRAAVYEHLPGNERRACHLRLARALESTAHADPEPLAAHWAEGGDLEKAAKYAALAAGQAMETLAFARATRLYQLAIELSPAGSAAERRALKHKLGEALAHSGRGEESAKAYLDAANGADAADELEYHRLAAEQLLRSGHIKRGCEVIDRVLRAMDFGLASTPQAALTSVLYRRARIRLRGLKFKKRDRSLIAPRDLTRIDMCWSVAVGLGIVDTIRGADFQHRQLLLALDAGEPYRAARALAMEAMYTAAAGGKSQSRTRRVLDIARAAAAESGNDAHVVGLVAQAEGMAAFLSGRWVDGRRHSEEAEAIFRNRCSGVTWELASAQMFLLWSLYFLGHFDVLKRRVPVLVKEARERGDLYALTNLRTEFVHLVELANDRPDIARAEASDAILQWQNDGFNLEHFWELHTQAQIDLYEGHGAAAHQRVEQRWPALRASLLPAVVQQVRIEANYLRGRAALAAVRDGLPARAVAQKAARKVAAEKMAWGTPLAEMLAASLLAHDGAPVERVNARVEAAIAGFEAVDMRLHAACARHRQSELDLPDAARRRNEAETWLADSCIVNPERMTDMVMPPLRFPHR